MGAAKRLQVPPWKNAFLRGAPIHPQIQLKFHPRMFEINIIQTLFIHLGSKQKMGIVTKEDLKLAQRQKVQRAGEKLSELIVVLREKMDSTVSTQEESIKDLLQEAQIRVEESHPDKLGKEDSIEDLKELERLLRESWDKLDEVTTGIMG